jgi:hypothetical protein
LMPSCFSILAIIWPLEIISGAAAGGVAVAWSVAVAIFNSYLVWGFQAGKIFWFGMNTRDFIDSLGLTLFRRSGGSRWRNSPLYTMRAADR